MATTTLDAPSSTNRRAEGGARSTVGAVVAGVGALLFVLALMIQFYAAPKLAVAPYDQNSVTHLQAENATVFDTATLKPIVTNLSILAHTVGAVDDSKKAGGDTRIWINNTTITSADGVVRSQSTSRSAFNGKTAEAVNCSVCNNFIETQKGARVPVKRTGLVYKFPFGTQAKSYQLWDDTARQAITTRYTGSTTLEGIKVDTFVNEVPATVVGTQDVPPSIFGLAGTGNVTADSYYQNHTTYYVEPVTGAIVNQVSDTKNWFQYNGSQLITTQAHITYTPQQVKDLIHKTLGSQPTMLATIQGWVPWVVVVFGLVLIVIGGGLIRGRQHA